MTFGPGGTAFKMYGFVSWVLWLGAMGLAFGLWGWVGLAVALVLSVVEIVVRMWATA